MGKELEVKSKFHVAFGKHLQAVRSRVGITQEKLAELVDIDRSYIGFIERGERNITLDKIYKLSKALKVKPKDLFDF